ncbi:predicted protein, partial [Nematostella vectensis]
MEDAIERAKEVTKKIFDLYRKYGANDYIGEPVSQTEHMVQAAMLAEKEGFGDDVILGAFFHDIGHLIGFDQGLSQMGDVGTDKHDIVGQTYLRDLGFPDSVTNMVWGHVEAKRYLVFKDAGYHEKTPGQNIAESNVPNVSPISRRTSPTIQTPVLQTSSEDEDFNRDPWLSMYKEFIENAPSVMRYTVGKVLKEAAAQNLKHGKVPCLCVLMKTFSPIGADASILLKDPT